MRILSQHCLVWFQVLFEELFYFGLGVGVVVELLPQLQVLYYLVHIVLLLLPLPEISSRHVLQYQR